MLPVPGKNLVQLLILLRQGDVGNRSCISIYTQRETCIIQPVNWMVSIAVIDVGLQVGSWTDFEVNVFFPQMCNQGWVLDTAYAVTYA